MNYHTTFTYLQDILIIVYHKSPLRSILQNSWYNISINFNICTLSKCLMRQRSLHVSYKTRTYIKYYFIFLKSYVRNASTAWLLLYTYHSFLSFQISFKCYLQFRCMSYASFKLEILFKLEMHSRTRIKNVDEMPSHLHVNVVISSLPKARYSSGE